MLDNQGSVNVGPNELRVHRVGRDKNIPNPNKDRMNSSGAKTKKLSVDDTEPLLVLPLELLERVHGPVAASSDTGLQLRLCFREVVLQFPNKSELARVHTRLSSWLAKEGSSVAAAAKLKAENVGACNEMTADTTPTDDGDFATGLSLKARMRAETLKHYVTEDQLHHVQQGGPDEEDPLQEALQDIEPLPDESPAPRRRTPAASGAFAISGPSGHGNRLDPGRMTNHDSSHASIARSLANLVEDRPEDDSASQFTQLTDGTGFAAMNDSIHGSISHLVEATLVERGSRELNEDAQSQGTLSTVHMVEAKPLGVVLSKPAAACGILVVAVLFVGLLAGLLANRDDPAMPGALTTTTNPTLSPSTMFPSSSPSFRPISTLQRVKERGILRCGAYNNHWAVDGASVFNSSQTMGDNGRSILANDISADVRGCRSIGAAVFGRSSYVVQMVSLGNRTRGLQSLADREVDVVLSHPTPTMDTDVFDDNSQTGYSISAPYAFDGLGFAGLPSYTACADDDMKSFFECQDLKICVYKGAEYFDLISGRVPGRNIFPTNSTMDTYTGFIAGECNVMAMEASALGEIFLRVLMGYTGEYAEGKNKFTKSFYATLTLDSDPEWSDFVNMLVLAGFAAEAMGITSENATLFGRTDVFGPDHSDMFIDSISVSGNFANVYELYQDYTKFLDAMIGPGNDAIYANYETLLPRTGWNLLNNGTTGLINAPAIRLAEKEGPGPEIGGTLARILSRGKVNCGVRTRRPGFADYVNGDTSKLEGMDVDYCRAISASIWGGDASLAEFIEVADEVAAFVALDNGEVDLIAGATWTLQSDVREPTTGMGFTFSQPYFYRPHWSSPDDERFDDNLCLGTRQDDPQWSSFVYWSAVSLVVAEDLGVTQRLSPQMPEVNLFGPQFQFIFRDAVHSVGNHGQIYERHVAQYVPRDGRNRLNAIKSPGPQLYVLPGFDALDS